MKYLQRLVQRCIDLFPLLYILLPTLPTQPPEAFTECYINPNPYSSPYYTQFSTYTTSSTDTKTSLTYQQQQHRVQLPLLNVRIFFPFLFSRMVAVHSREYTTEQLTATLFISVEYIPSGQNIFCIFVQCYTHSWY